MSTVSSINQSLTQYTTTPARTKPDTFREDMDTRLSEQTTNITETNTLVDEINTTASGMNTVASEVNDNAAIATTKASEASISASQASVSATESSNDADRAETALSGITSGVPVVNDIYSLIFTTPSGDNDSAYVLGYLINTNKGGGRFYWDASADKSTANGGTIIDPDTLGGFDGTTATISAFLNAQGTGVGTGCWKRQYNGGVNAKWFGAVGDGAADDTAAVQAVVDFSNANGVKIHDYSGSNYHITSNITCANCDMEGNFTISGTGGAYFIVQGTLTEIGTVSVASTAGENEVTLSTVSGLSAGDNIIIHNTTANSFATFTGRNYMAGEFNEIDSISVATLTLRKNTIFDYAAAATNKVFKLTDNVTNIKGVTFETDGSTGLQIRYQTKVDIEDVNSTVGDTVTPYSAIYIDKCCNILVRSGKPYTPFASSFSYGLNFSNCSSGRVYDLNSYGGRHAVTMGGDAANGAVPCFDIVVYDSTLKNSPVASVYCADVHGNAINCGYDGCHIYGAVGLAGQDPFCQNSTVYTWAGNDIPCGMHEVVGGTVLFDNIIVKQDPLNIATEIVGPVSAAISAEIAGTWNLRVKDIEAEFTAATTSVVNFFENSGQANAVTLDGFGVSGTLTAYAQAVNININGAGIDPAWVTIKNTLNPSLLLTIPLVTLSGTTLAGVRKEYITFSGSDANGDWTKYADGTMEMNTVSAATPALTTAEGNVFTGAALTTAAWPSVYADMIIIYGTSCFTRDENIWSTCLPSAGLGLTYVKFWRALSSATTTTFITKTVGRWYIL